VKKGLGVSYKGVFMHNCSKEPIETEDLRLIKDKAWEFFFQYRGSDYRKSFEKYLKIIALCQGAALHYAVTHGHTKEGYSYKGVKDIDVWNK
jgi:hypothetical protein